MQKASVPISKSQRLRKNCGHKKAPKTGLSGAPCWIRTSGLTLRSMAYHVIHGSDVTSNIIPYTE